MKRTRFKLARALFDGALKRNTRVRLVNKCADGMCQVETVNRWRFQFACDMADLRPVS